MWAWCCDCVTVENHSELTFSELWSYESYESYETEAEKFAPKNDTSHLYEQEKLAAGFGKEYIQRHTRHKYRFH